MFLSTEPASKESVLSFHKGFDSAQPDNSYYTFSTKSVALSGVEVFIIKKTASFETVLLFISDSII